VVTLGVTFAVSLAATVACGARTGDYTEDFSEAVEEICTDYCTMFFACRDPSFFESYEDCETRCSGLGYIYNDTACGQSQRDMIGCIGSQPTCELFNDTENVFADDYTCKAEKDYDTSLYCGQVDEDPYAQTPP
jgi:hypothetical protein